MKRRLICCSFASKEGYNGSANAGKNIDAVDIYIKNACVCCFSAKKYNPTCDVAFIHNLSEVPEQYDKFLRNIIFYLFMFRMKNIRFHQHINGVWLFINCAC